MIGQTAPTSDADRFAQVFADYERRIADLERSAGRLSSRYAAKSMGHVGTITDAADHNTITTVETDVLSGSLTLVAGRKYWMTGRVHTIQTVATDSFWVRMYAGGGLVQTLLTTPTAAQQILQPSSSVFTAAGGSTVLKITYQRFAGTGNVSAANAGFINAVLNVFDVGTP